MMMVKMMGITTEISNKIAKSNNMNSLELQSLYFKQNFINSLAVTSDQPELKGVDRNIVWDILKKSPIDPRPIRCQIDHKTADFEERNLIRLRCWNCSLLTSDPCKLVRRYLGSFVVHNQWVLDHMKCSPIDHPSKLFYIYQKIQNFDT